MKTILAGSFLVLVSFASVPDLTGDPMFQHPLIKEHGGIVVLPDAAQQPKQNSKVVLDIISDKKSGKVITGFDRAALILNQYTQASAGTENGLKLAIILHGPATRQPSATRDMPGTPSPTPRTRGRAKIRTST